MIPTVTLYVEDSFYKTLQFISQKEHQLVKWILLMSEYIYERMQKTCLKHCTETLLKAELDPLETLCLKRCIFKYTEAQEFAQQ